MTTEKINESLGDVLLKTETVIKTFTSSEDSSIEVLLEDLKQVASVQGFRNIWIDETICKWFPNEKVSNKNTKTGRLIRFVKKINHIEILSICKSLGNYQEYGLSDGIKLSSELIRGGNLDQCETGGILIYLNCRKNGAVCALHIWRNAYELLALCIYEMDAEKEFLKNEGMLVST